MKSGNLNFLEPSGPLQVCDGTALYDSEKENWRILTNKEIYASIKKPTIIETIRLNTLRWFGHVQRMEENRISKKYCI